MVHQYKSNGYNIVLDSASGSIHVMDDLAYELVSIIGREIERGTIVSPVEMDIRDVGTALSDFEATEHEISEAYDEVCVLYNSNSLFTEDKYERDVSRFLKMPTVIKALCLNVSHDCNLACKYCFAGEGEYHGTRELMSIEVGKRALEFLVEHSGGRKNLEVDFFGGEPLMNLDMVKATVKYGRELERIHDKHFRFTLTTNGLLLNEDFYEFANRELDNVVLSLDGRKEVHDSMRPTRSGNGSYDIITSKILDFSRNRGGRKHYIRGTFTGKNLDFSEDIMHMANLGFKEISMEPVVAPDSCDYSITDENVPALLEEYDKLAKYMASIQGTDKDFSFFHFNIDLSGGPCVYKRLTGCGAGSEYIAVTPNGDIYPCHQFVGLEDFIIGNVITGINNTDITDEFKGVNVYTKKECKTCFANMYCSGGCMANSYNSTGRVDGMYEIGCKLEKKRVECAIMLEVNRRLANND